MKIIHAIRSDGGEYPAESEYILCDPLEGFADPKVSIHNDQVTCKRCLKIIKPQAPTATKEN